MTTVVYTDGGEGYLGHNPDEPVHYWQRVGRKLGQKWMYIGHGPVGGDMGLNRVVVYDTKRWSEEEKEQRRKNGFFNIVEYPTSYMQFPTEGIEWPHL